MEGVSGGGKVRGAGGMDKRSYRLVRGRLKAGAAGRGSPVAGAHPCPLALASPGP